MCKVIFTILVISIQLTLNQNCECINTTLVRNNYFKYLTEVVDHICHQTKWNLMINELLISNSDKELLRQKVEKSNFLFIFNYIVNIFNYKYIEILQTFVEHVGILIEECENYLTAQLFNNFMDCTAILEIEMKKSTEMFNRIYKVMWFLSYLDVKRVFVKITSNPYTVVDEVYLVKHFIDSIRIKDHSWLANNEDEYIAKVNEALVVIINTKELIKKVTERAISVLNEMSALLVTPQRLDLKFKYKNEYHSQEFIENDFFHFVLNCLNSFYKITKTNYYDNFKFDIILNPDVYNVKQLIPPQEEPLPLDNELTTLKRLVDEGEWKNIDHISIIHHGLVISANRIVRDPVSMHGFNLKKQYILQLLKCRFFEMFSNFYSYFSPIVLYCNQLSKTTYLYLLTYINCIKNLYEISKSSKYFFNKIYSVVKHLKDVSIWEVTSVRISLSSTEKFLEYFIETFNNDYLYEDVFKENTEPFLMTKAYNYLKDMIHKRTILNEELYRKSKPLVIRCQFLEKSSPVISNPEKIMKKNDDLTDIKSIDDHLNACIELSTFCKNSIDIDFKDMGFDKIF
ncbi:uncharacterized protein LOC126907317 [Daktulosphaira vitifoliae]|uniref:uncharacterized protein LOC126907317 n=1 Tax=Daktulosphaira vitifoliae TaxID=58002 RepID=UPI0021A9F059|nr:uncharacterized protein LOC126907317 [Daktulosphaira vitifoliae]